MYDSWLSCPVAIRTYRWLAQGLIVNVRLRSQSLCAEQVCKKKSGVPNPSWFSWGTKPLKVLSSSYLSRCLTGRVTEGILFNFLLIPKHIPCAPESSLMDFEGTFQHSWITPAEWLPVKIHCLLLLDYNFRESVSLPPPPAVLLGSSLNQIEHAPWKKKHSGSFQAKL